MTSTTTSARNIQVLSAMDFGPVQGVTPDIAALVAKMGDAVLRVVTHQVADCRSSAAPGDTVTEHLVVFDAGMLRNTEAHGMGYRRGFVVCVRQPSQVQEALDADTRAQEAAALADLNGPRARRTLVDTLARARRDFGVLYITVCLPQPWGAAQCWADGRVTDCQGRENAALSALVA